MHGSYQDVGITYQFLSENMRREGYELQVSRQVIIKEIDGVKYWTHLNIFDRSPWRLHGFNYQVIRKQ